MNAKAFGVTAARRPCDTLSVRNSHVAYEVRIPPHEARTDAAAFGATSYSKL